MEMSWETILLLLPLVALQFGLAIYCIIKIFTEGVRNLNKWVWLAICVLFNILGSVCFLLFGRKQEYS